ncbi:hypothetical protein BG000_011880 [Podila horticola]|nr:hypothetical protein BG000_011880 [Podila horticola]
MSSVTQGVPLASATRLVKVPVSTKRSMGLSTSPGSMETDLEDMLMTETPPLDLGSDSGEDPDDENTMYDTLSYSPAPSLPSSTTSPMVPRPIHKNVSFSPAYPSSTQPISILHHSKKSQAKAAFSHPSFELDLEPEPKSVKGLRPSVSFDLDEHNSEQEDLALLSIERNSSSHTHGVKGHPQASSQSSLLSFQLMDQMFPSKSLMSMPDSFEPLEAQGQDHADRLSCIENHITPSACSTNAQSSSWAEPTQTTKIANDTDNKNESKLIPPQETNLIHLVCPAPSEMLVALVDRPSELEALAAIHSDFFNLMYSSLSSNARGAFKTLLFTPRDALSDSDWMQGIAQRLESLPCLLQKFKFLVGWIDCDEDDFKHASDDEDEYGYEDFLEYVEIKSFRDLDGFSVEVFEKCYPQFFTLGLSRQELACDNAWTQRMNGCLEKNPELLLQFKEIVAYEVEYDD